MRNLRFAKRGQGLVEFAFVLPIFLMVVMGIIDFARVFHSKSALELMCTQAARTGSRRIYQLIARSAYTPTTHETRDHVESAFWNNLSPLMPRSRIIGPNIEGVGTSAQTVKVSAICRVEVWTPFIEDILGQPFEVAAVAEENKE